MFLVLQQSHFLLALLFFLLNVVCCPHFTLFSYCYCYHFCILLFKLLGIYFILSRRVYRTHSRLG
uniref:Putative ovule protein n=1 Tax=Solanum chacoense TaxID=4108 RepID=A0A0V0GYZ5_SOLCH